MGRLEIRDQGTSSNDKAQMPNKAQNPNVPPAEVARLLESYGEQVRPACAKARAKASGQA